MTPPSVESRRIVEFSDYWTAKARADRIPSFRDILPEEVFRLLPNLVVWRAIDGGADFLCRIVGQDLTENYGGGQQGRRLSALTAENASVGVFAVNFRRCMAIRRLLVAIDQFQGHRGTPKKTIGIIAPLADDGVTITDVICCSNYVEGNELAAVDARLSSLFERSAIVA